MSSKKKSNSKSPPKKSPPKKSEPKKSPPKKSEPKKSEPKKSDVKIQGIKSSSSKSGDKKGGDKKGGDNKGGDKKGGDKKGGDKKGGDNKSGVKIHGIQGKVNLRRDILKPLKSDIQSVKPDFTNKDWKSVRDPFKEAAADGKITKKELAKIQSGVANTSGKSGFTYNEGQLAQGAIPNAIDAQQYSRYIDSAQGDMQSFRNNQEGIINDMMKSQREAMQSQLAQIEGGANSSLNNYRNTLDQSMAQSQQMLQGQRDAFAQGNAQSMQNVQKSQSQIQSLPGFEQYLTDQISSSFKPVDGMDPFLNIGLRQGPISVKRDPTITGFSSSQKASSARQQQGIQGFRTKQVA